MLNGDGEMLRELERFATSKATEEVILKLGSLRRCQSARDVSAGRRLRIGGTTIGIHGSFSLSVTGVDRDETAGSGSD
jgi:hypothetical protein